MSRVFVDDDGVWRGLSNEALADYERLAASTFFRDAMARGDIVGTERVDDESSAGRVGRGAPARSHRRAVVPVRVAVRDAARRGAAPARAHPRRARPRSSSRRTRRRTTCSSSGTQAGLHRCRLVRAAPRRRAVARLSPVLRAVPQPTARPGVARRAVPAVAARQRPRHLADASRPTCCAARGASPRACSPTSSCTPGPSASTPTPTAIATSRPNCSGPGSVPA